MFGKKIVFSDSHKKKLSTALKGKPSKLKGVSRSRVACPKCRVTGGDGAMYRWHFENCRYESKP
jgi:hypothetical protein